MAAKMEKTKTPGVFKRGSRYVVTWTYRGKQRKESFRTYAEAREAKAQRQAGDKRPVSRIRFGEYYEAWIESYAGRTARGFSETTRLRYRQAIEPHTLPIWRTWKLADIETPDIRALFKRLRDQGQATSTIRNTRAALSALFATAVEDGKLKSNPAQGVRIPAGPDTDDKDAPPKALGPDELVTLLDVLPGRRWYRLFYEFLAATGLRVSEARGLTWTHLELGSDSKVKVREQVYKGERKKLKSNAGRREVDLTPEMAEQLLAHRRDTYAGDDAPVFPTLTGEPFDPNNLHRRVLEPAAVALGHYETYIDKQGRKRKRSTVTFHTFRHTCASMLFAEGRNVREVADWLGHTDPSFTLRRYIHLVKKGPGKGLSIRKGGKRVAIEEPQKAENEQMANA